MSLTFGPVAKGCVKSRAPACAGRDWRRDSLHPASSSSSSCCWGSPGTPRPPQPAAGLHVGSLPNEDLASLSACFSKLGLITSSLTFLIRAGAEHGRRRPAPVPSSPPSGERRFFPSHHRFLVVFCPSPELQPGGAAASAVGREGEPDGCVAAGEASAAAAGGCGELWPVSARPSSRGTALASGSFPRRSVLLRRQRN